MGRPLCFPTAVLERHICIGGFTQQIGAPTGIHRLYSQMRARVSGSDVVVSLHRWCDDWKRIADEIELDAQGHKPRVFVYAYSWGGGWGFTQLAKYLDKKGIKIECVVLCDAVYRSRWLTFSWRSLCSLTILTPKIRVRKNVERVYSFVQSQSLPCGHELEADDEDETTIYEQRTLQADHVSMDDQTEFHDLAMAVALSRNYEQCAVTHWSQAA